VRRFSGLRSLAALALAIGAMVPIALQASPAAANSGDVIAIGGSDTTQNVMHAIFDCKDDNLGGHVAGKCDAPPANNWDSSFLYNLKVPPNVTNDVVLPADTKCDQVTFESNVRLGSASGNPNAPASGKEWTPFGSSDGRNRLEDSILKTWPNHVSAYAISNPTTGGCLDVARSSAGPRSPCGSGSSVDDCTAEYYAFALDAVGWGSTSLLAPPSMTLQQLRDIYDCKYNDWSQVGGKPGPIQRFLPQTGSGTGDFFVQNVLGKSSASRTQFANSGTLAIPPNTAITCPAVIADSTGPGSPNIEENNGKIFLDPAVRGLYQQMIAPYSSGLWVYQANNSANPNTDRRAGFRPGGLVNPTLLPSAPTAWSVRWVNSEWRLNDATIVNGRSVTVGPVNALNTTITGSPCTPGTPGPNSFSATDIGRSVQGGPINDGTIITAISNGNCTATISPSTKNSTLFTSYPFTGAVTVGYAVVSEFNPNVLTPSNLEYAGVRYVYNVVNSASPNDDDARDLVGFTDANGGVVSDLCNGTYSGVIDSNGFLSLPALDRDGTGVGNDTLRTCVKRVPS
jgi:hypothetical protein